MRHLGILISTLLFSIISCQTRDQPIALTQQNIIKDLLLLKNEITNTHPNPFYRTSKSTFEDKIQHLLDYNNTYNVDQQLVKMLEIVASIGDGHTNLRPFSYYNQYPIRFYWRQDHIYVSGTINEHKEFLGAKLKAIGDTPIEKAAKKTFNIIPGYESETFSRDWATYYFTIPEIMFGLDITSSKKEIIYTLLTKNNELKKITLKIDNQINNPEIKRPYTTKPEYYITKENGLWFEEANEKLIYFHFSNYPKSSVFKKIGTELKKALKKSENKYLFIDLRRNGGGNFNKGRKLIDIIEGTVKSQNTKVYVGISGSTYSAAVANATDFKKRLGAILIGETTGGRPNGYQENNSFVLPNTKIPGSCSSEYYKFQEEDTPGVFPDIEVKLKWENYANGEDVILNYLYNNILN